MSFTRRSFLKLSALSIPAVSMGAWPETQDAPVKIKVLGIMQDGGLPQLGDNCERCKLAREDSRYVRYVTCLGIVTPDNKTFLLDATPDIKNQIEMLNKGISRLEKNPKKPVDGIFLTHAHMGHYTGLMHLGFESISSDMVPVYCTASMEGFLLNNAPWDLLVRKRNIELIRITEGKDVEISRGVYINPFNVPHRQEYTDTVGFIIKGKNKSMIFLPDIDRWEEWHDAERMLGSVDIALVDGSFYSGNELPGRDMTKIPHPTITSTMNKFGSKELQKRSKIYFIHFNHSNPVLNIDDTARNEIRQKGFFIVDQGMEFEL